MRKILLIAFLATEAVGAQRTTADITTADLEYRLKIIADDSMMGRESGSKGDYVAAEYVASEFRRLGLQPAGEGGTYFQTVPFSKAAIDSTSQLAAQGTVLQVERDFIPASVRAPARTINGVSVIYGGDALDSSQWISPSQATGKIVLLNLAPNAVLRGLGRRIQRWRPATAIAIDNLDELGSEQRARLREGFPISDTTRDTSATPVILISRHAAEVLLGAAPSTLTPGATGATVSGHFDIARSPMPYAARNVIAVLRGSDPRLRGEYVSLTAHNDHVGFDHSPVDHDSLRAFNRVIRPMGADSPVRDPTPDEWTRIRAIIDSARRQHPPRRDSIRNGADDDGSGTVAILEIAEKMAQSAQKPKRSILFVSHTGEEAGLLGSQWYTDHPTVPLDSIVGEIDQDMIGRGKTTDFPHGGTGAGSPTYLEVVGAKRLSKQFGELLEAANAKQPVPFVFNYEYDVPGHPLQYYCRADHYSYARYGIPSVALSRGEHLDYHQVTDEAQYIDYPDMARVTRMVYDAAMSLSNVPVRPALDSPKQQDPHAPCVQ
jgi:Peptidase family M28